AFFDCGRLNARMPLEIASTPVRAEDPDANACISSKRETAPTPAGTGEGTFVMTGQPPMHRTRPTMMRMNIDTMKPYTGNANSMPDSRTPRRFASAMNTTNASESGTLYGPSVDGAIDTIASTPDATDTDTVST